MEFKFEEKGHKYTLDGKPLTGITTILGVIAKPALINWASGMACDYVRNNLTDMKDLDAVLSEAKNAHRKKKEEAGQKGTDIHAIIEGLILEVIKNNGIIAGHNLNEEKQVSHFVDWAMENEVKFLESEKRMYSEKMWLAGTCDFTCEIDGKKYMGDIKTGSGIYPEHFFQTAAYRMMQEEMGEKDFVGSIIINIKKDGTFTEDNDVIISYGYDEEKEAFLGALKLYRVINSYEIKKGKL